MRNGSIQFRLSALLTCMYSSKWEKRQVEMRGLEPLASAVQRRRSPN
jgi:hypothetical protein